MIIIHCIQEAIYHQQKDSDWIGEHLLLDEDFIHCSTPDQFSFVSPRFDHTKEQLILLALDTDKIAHPIRWEGKEMFGKDFPHIYGLINCDSIIAVYPYLRKEDGSWIKNPEL
ncbi:MAG: DUF952 domain-containing protein [Erysipelotrichaceae bacterium]